MKDWQPLARIDELSPLLGSLPREISPVRQNRPAGTWRRVRSEVFVSGGDDARVGNERQAAVNAAHSLGTNVIAERDYE
jgi:hypothetical protein